MSEIVQLANVVAERSVLAGICRYGAQSYYDVADIIGDGTFTVPYNQNIFICIKHAFKQEIEKLDVATIISAAEEIGLIHAITEPRAQAHLNSLFSFPVDERNVRKFAAKIRKLEIARLLQTQMHIGADKLTELTGDESVSQILGIAEDAIFDFSSLINDNDAEPKRIGDSLSDYIEHLIANPIDQLGIPTGFPEYDKAIGGGLRNGTVNVFGARVKVGKSLLGTNIGWHIATKQKIPVLNMDTELTFEDHLHRMLAMASECYIYDIETGKFGQKPGQANKVRRVVKQIENEKIPYFHKSIAGMPFEEQMAVMRRWILKEVGLNTDGTAKPCVIVYDYLKLMTAEGLSGQLQEYQLLGFMMTSLHNFTVRYKLPIVLFIQLNRDGINKEDTDAMSGSDRVAWLCSNFSIFKYKSDEEIAADGVENGNRKIVPIVSRHGAGMDKGNYINCYFQGNIAKIVEGKTAFQILEEGKKKDATKDEVQFVEQSSGQSDSGSS